MPCLDVAESEIWTILRTKQCIINRDRMLFADFSVNSEPISFKPLLFDPNSGEIFAKIILDTRSQIRPFDI